MIALTFLYKTACLDRLTIYRFVIDIIDSLRGSKLLNHPLAYERYSLFTHHLDLHSTCVAVFGHRVTE